jgi:hypothetical protein
MRMWKRLFLIERKVGVKLTSNTSKVHIRIPVLSSYVRNISVGRNAVEQGKILTKIQTVATKSFVEMHVTHMRRVQCQVGLASWGKVLVRRRAGKCVVQVHVLILKPVANTQRWRWLLEWDSAKVESHRAGVKEARLIELKVVWRQGFFKGRVLIW